LKVCHFTTELIPYIRDGARRFGLFVVPNPDGKIPLVRLPGDEPAYLSANTPLKRDQDYCWVPASLLEELQTEKPSASIQEIIELHGDRIVRARVDARFEIENYFGEISRVISSGIPLPEERWHELSEVQRRTILREIGAQPSWTVPPRIDCRSNENTPGGSAPPGAGLKALQALLPAKPWRTLYKVRSITGA
jgi:hypothetical protein